MPEKFSLVSQSNDLVFSLYKQLPSFNQAWQTLSSMFLFNQALQTNKTKPITAPSPNELPNLNKTNPWRFDMLHRRDDDFVPRTDPFGICYEADKQWFSDYVLLNKHDTKPILIQSQCRSVWDSYLQLMIVVLSANQGYLLEDPDCDDWIYAKDANGLKKALRKVDNYWLRNDEDVAVSYDENGCIVGYAYKGLTKPAHITWLIEQENKLLSPSQWMTISSPPTALKSWFLSFQLENNRTADIIYSAMIMALLYQLPLVLAVNTYQQTVLHDEINFTYPNSTLSIYPKNENHLPNKFNIATVIGSLELGVDILGGEYYDATGIITKGIGDVNNDTYSDILISLPRMGQVYLVLGRASWSNTPSLQNIKKLVFTNLAVNSDSRNTVSAAGDIDGDGCGDILLGSDEADLPDLTNTGVTYLVYGCANLDVASKTMNISKFN